MARRTPARSASRLAAATAAAVVAEALYAALRPSPAFRQFDASGTEGDPGLGDLHLVVVGDSTTTGPGLKKPGDIWVRVLARMIAERFDVHVRVTSFAIGGSRASDILSTQLDDAIEAAGDITFISVGGNDALRFVGARSFARHLDEIVGRLAAVSPLVVQSGVGDLGTIPRLLPPLRHFMRARGRLLDRVHQKIAERHGTLKVDMWGLTAHVFREHPEIFSADLFHPTELGHEVWAQATMLTLEPHLPDLIERIRDSGTR